MVGIKSKIKKKPMTLEDLAVVIRQDLSLVATKKDLARMATKEDLGVIRKDVATLSKDVVTVRNDVAALRDDVVLRFGVLESRIGTVHDELQEQISGLKYAQEIDELSGRVVTVEEKLGIRPSRRAA